jgi:MOSC domain-containing protein YiiM
MGRGEDWFEGGASHFITSQAAGLSSGVHCSSEDRIVSATPDTNARVTSVNVGHVREVTWHGRRIRTGIWKTPIDAPSVMARGVNLDGDDQADRRVHGGPDKAVYSYAVEDYLFWQQAEGFALTSGLFGENLTVRGLELRDAVVGERWRVGTAVLEVAQPRLPCYKLGIRVGDDDFPRRFEEAGRMGAYLRIVAEGAVAPNDPVEVISRPDHGVTLRGMLEALGDRERLRGLLCAPELPAFWRQLAERA